MTQYASTDAAVHRLGYHLIWCPKYRRRVLVDGVDERCKELLAEKAAEHGSGLRPRLQALWYRSYIAEQKTR